MFQISEGTPVDRQTDNLVLNDPSQQVYSIDAVQLIEGANNYSSQGEKRCL